MWYSNDCWRVHSVRYSAMTNFNLFLLCLCLATGSVVSDVCPGGYSAFETSCYKSSESLANFYEAQEACKANGGYIAEVTTAEENEFLKNLMSVLSCWIGLSQIVIQFNFVYATSGNPIVFANWNSGEPNDICVEMFSDGFWNEKDCGISTNYLCETFACPDGFERNGDSCYYFSNDTKKWMDAVTACENLEDSYLVEIEGEDESNYLIDKVSELKEHMWTGGNDLDVEGTFVWYTSGNEVMDGPWLPRNPSNSFYGEDCLQIRYGADDKTGWNDARCTKVSLRYICEKKY